MIKPKRLQKGDTVGIIAPAGTPHPEYLERGLNFLSNLDLKIKLGRHVNSQNGYLAGSDEERVADLHTMFMDRSVKAIFCARGGYGTGRIASMIDYRLIEANPKIFWGYSDITFLHLTITKQTGLVTFHGPMIASDFGRGEINPLTTQYFQQVFNSNQLQFNETLSPLKVIVDGTALGPLIGGNLTLITSTLGTDFEIDTNGKVLLIEEVNEEPRAIDRMLNQLYMAGKLQESAGIVLGDFHNCIPESEPSIKLEDVFTHYLKLANRPALMGLQIGHCSPNLAVPLGVNALIDTYNKQFLVDSGIAPQ